MKIASLFAGYGGLDMAVEQVFPNARPAWFCEWDDAPSKILTHHWPDVPNHRDVTQVDWAQVEPVDILAGGFPCQDVSHAGRRQGLIRDGEGKTRSGLWGEMLKAIDTLRPPLVVAENVRGLLSATADSDVEPCPFCMGDGGASPMRALGAVLADLGDIGFDAAWCGLRAADVGAAHGRFRVFILAWPAADTEGDSRRIRDRDPVLAGRGADGREQAAGGGYAAPLTLLPTPRATDGTKGGPNQRGSSGDLMLPSAVHLLPTPQARDYKDHQVQVAGHRPEDKDSINRAIAHLLADEHEEPVNGNADSANPGQELRDVRHSNAAQAVREEAGGPGGVHASEVLLAEMREHPQGSGQGHSSLAGEATQEGSLHGMWDARESARSPRRSQPGEQRSFKPGDAMRVVPPAVALAGGPRCPHGCGAACGGHSTVAWGEYEAAIRRWEVRIGRPAPAPTESGRNGTHRLSPIFVEFLMGLPAGHVTDPNIGLTRNQQLKALGNGVVPAQGAAALRHLLDIRNSYLTTSWKVAA